MKKRKKKTAATTPTAKKGSPALSVCLIVKNEERYIEQCLRSVETVADEIVIVDTGSTDRTVALARKYTDRIYFHPWQDSFSAARNHYLAYARGEWIFQIDADEELVREDIPLVRRVLSEPDIDAVAVQIVSYARQRQVRGAHYVERIFRNNGVIHYEGRVHNRLVGIRNSRLAPIRLLHYGYDNTAGDAEKKFQRTEGLLRLDLADDPRNPYTHHYLSCSYLSREMYEPALTHGREALSLAAAAGNDDVIFLWTRYNVALAYYRLKNLPRARETALQSLARFPDHLDSHFIMIVICFDTQNWRELVHHGDCYLRLVKELEENPARFGRLASCSLNDAWNIHVLIGIAHYELGDKTRAEDSFARAEATAPEPFLAVRAIGIFFARKGMKDRARHYLGKAHRIDPDEETVRNLLAGLGDPDRPARDKEPKISACMIVKDEEAFLENCLQSIQDWVDEIIVVDTGSRDKTVEIAQRFTDRVYFHPWQNSFSVARNQAMSYATGDWILTIDADEELLAGSGALLRQAVREAGDADAVYCNVISIFSGGKKQARHNSERLLRNNGVIHYEGRVHNRVVGVQRPKMSRVELMHYGYNVEEKKSQEKFLRTVSLLKEQIQEAPENPMPHHYLGTSYLARGMYRESLGESRQAIELAEQGDHTDVIYLTTHHNAALASFELGDRQGARDYSLRALRKYPDHLDSIYMLAVLAAEEKNWRELLKYGRRYLELRDLFETHPDRAGVVLNSSIREGWRIHSLLGHAHHARKEFPLMAEHYRAAVAAADDKWRCLLHIAIHHLDRSQDMETASRYLDLAHREAPDEPAVWFVLAKWHHRRGDQEGERTSLVRLFELGTDDAAMLNRLADLSLAAGDPDTAARALDALIKTCPDDYNTLCKLGELKRRQHDPAGAIEVFGRAVSVNPAPALPWLNLGEIPLQLGDLQNAETFFERVLTLEARPIQALLSLCEIELRKGRLEGFIDRCDRLLAALGLPRSRTINSCDDLTALVEEIRAALPASEGYAAATSAILSLLPK